MWGVCVWGVVEGRVGYMGRGRVGRGGWKEEQERLSRSITIFFREVKEDDSVKIKKINIPN